MTDHAKIIQYLLLSDTGLTAAEWCKCTGSTKLTTRISELRDAGAEFFEKWYIPDGDHKRYKRYYLRSLKNYKK